MIDLHSHILPGIDDGAPDIATSLSMARAWVADGVSTVACTPHILPGLFPNTGPDIRQAVIQLQDRLDDAGIALKLVPGADNHVTPNFVDGLRRGHLLSLADSRYVLVEPPHHTAPPRLEDLFFNIMAAGYTPILTHPERLTWIESEYDLIVSLATRGVWMQITAGALTGSFGRSPRYWGERMLCEGLVHILATDAHNIASRPPVLSQGLAYAARLVGDEEAERLAKTRPLAVLENRPPSSVAPAVSSIREGRDHARRAVETKAMARSMDGRSHSGSGSLRWLQRIFS
ncbi:MAG: tyrosine-protein phosphatase [Methylocystis sp.]|uniref:tyrosine-protein phosphatase n=1 Tax=Methylocystis sp. TaxID=1911079 RepID=UPI003DA3A5C0